MHITPPAIGAWSDILLLAAIYLLIKSRRKSQTMTWMLGGFFATFLLCFILGLLRIGDPRAWGRMAVLIGLLVAVIAGWWHLRTRGPTNEPSAQPIPKG